MNNKNSLIMMADEKLFQHLQSNYHQHGQNHRT